VRAALAGLLAALLLLPSACGSAGRPRGRSSAAAAHARRMRTGAGVFAERCSTCHPLLGRPNTDVHTDYVPPLDLDQVRPAAAYARAIVESGKVAMGSFGSELDAGRLDAVVRYVAEVSGREVTVPSGTPSAQLAAGARLYGQHCAGCHAIAGSRPTHPNPIWPATDFADVRPSVLYVEQKVREGQTEAMPAFGDRLTPQQIRAVALYVNATAR
jgi:mono/diheme cytochrome c family protein